MITLSGFLIIVGIILIIILVKISALQKEQNKTQIRISTLSDRVYELDTLLNSLIKQTGFKTKHVRKENMFFSHTTLVPQTDEDIEIVELKKRIRELQNKNDNQEEVK